ncbi:MAG: hypothetical protein R3A51_09580 [Nannocystaceae bacterium]|nr:hypothetical protein [Myxococcales bacterium]
MGGPAAAEAPERREHGEHEAVCVEQSGVGVHVDCCDHGGHHKEHTRNLLGVKAMAVGAITGPEGERGVEAVAHGGGGIFYERELIQNWLEIEPNVGILSAPGGVLIPLDLLLKKPFHVHHKVTPYLGVGPAIEFLIAEERGVFGGVTATVGLYVWFGKHVGIDIELSYSLVFERGRLVHNPAGGVGPVVHF